MKSKTVKKLNDILDIATEVIDVPDKVSERPVTPVTTDLTSDYDFSRDQYQNLI